MKKLFITLLVICGVATGVSAQEVGKIWVGGSVGFKSSKTTDMDRLTNYNIIPEIGYQMSENLGIGISLGYKHIENFDELSPSFEKVKANGFVINPFARYSFLKGSIGYLFVDGGVGYSHFKYSGDDDKLQQFEVGFRPGVAINVSDKITLTGKVGFLGYEYGKYGDSKQNNFGFDFDLSQVLLGVNIIF